jgi:phytol kinase
MVISTLADKSKKVDKETSRKIVHIGVANCWWIAVYFFDSLIFASIPPIFFIVFNFMSVKFNIVKSMERESEGYGTVFYPISLLILTIFCFGGISPLYVGSIAMCCMGYGDGFAAMIGSKFGKTKLKFLRGRKSLEGCTAMFLVSFVSSAAILSYYGITLVFVYSAIIATAAACSEMLTPDGYDNLSVPLVVGLFTHIII